MKIGMSSYCLDREIEQGCMTLPECIDWAARQGADCLELVPFAFRFDDCFFCTSDCRNRSCA